MVQVFFDIGVQAADQEKRLIVEINGMHETNVSFPFSTILTEVFQHHSNNFAP